jgi:hypothetical protein
MNNSFNNRTLNDADVIKGDLIKYIYQNAPLYRFRYRVLKSSEDLNVLADQPHYVGLNYVGFNNLLVFSKFRNFYYSFFVDRKSLKYNIEDLDINQAIIRPVAMKASAEVYSGSIFDGILVNVNGTKKFIITDAYILSGDDNILKVERNEKLKRLKFYVEQNIKFDNEYSYVNFVIDTMYEYKDLVKIKNEVIPESEIKVRGLVFYPKYSGRKYIYTFPPPEQQITYDNEDVEEIGCLTEKDLEVEVKVKSDVKNTYSIKARFEIRKTDIPDVYDLYVRHDTKNKVKKYGIAYIPTNDCSTFCRELFEGEEEKTIVVKCGYAENKGKWMPMKVSKKKPSKFEKVKKLLE